MLDGIDTGYEGKFDFPGRDRPPETCYLLATVPRTGSTFLSHLLWRSGCLGAPLEYLNFDPAGPYAFAGRSPALQLQLWRSLLRRRTSPNGVFGIKCFPMQLQALVETNPELMAAVMSTIVPRTRPPRVVHLARRDRASHAVSYARATMSGIWRKEQERGGPAELEYSQAAMETAERWLTGQEAAWDAMFRDLRIAPLRLIYEDVVERPQEAVAQVAFYLGVTIDPAAEVDVPTVDKQSEAGAEGWTERYAASKTV